MKKCIDFFDEHWHKFISAVVFVLTLTIMILIVAPKDGGFFNNVLGNIFLSALITFFVGGCLCGVFINWADNYSTNKRIALKSLFTVFCVLLVVSALLLGRFLFTSEETVEKSNIIGGENVIVYTTDTGDCYHKSYCGYLKSKHQTTQHDAESDGYSPCSACFNGVGLRRDITTSKEEIYNYGTGFIVSSIFWVVIYVLTAIAIIKKKDVN